MLQKESYSQVINYAKGWYKQTYPIKDLKTILAHRSGTDSKFMSIGNVYNAVIELLLKYSNSYQLNYFFNDIFLYGIKYKKITSLGKIILTSLSKLSNIQIKDDEGNLLIDLEEPDYTILPKNETVTKKSYEQIWGKELI